ncbi:MAG: hypothetical protein KA902_01300 [Arenimonas sp.]|nr:hypothetical protein [Arenimonas sp.]
MSSLKDKAEALQDHALTLLEAQAEYYKLWSFKVSMKSVTFLVHAFLMTLFITLCVLFASVAFAFWLGEYFDSNALGFLLAGGVYLLLGVLTYLLRDKIDRPILKKFSTIFFND